jgi:hypothetical protein
MSMILLVPANKITQLNVEIKRRTISLTGFHPSSSSRPAAESNLDNPTLQECRFKALPFSMSDSAIYHQVKRRLNFSEWPCYIPDYESK